MPTENELRENYSRLDLDHLLKLASESATLTEIARRLLDEELRKRNLSYKEMTALPDGLSLWDKQKEGLPIAHRGNGCGTTLIGVREIWPDGSYITEKWITIFFIPIYRVEIMRVKRIVLENGLPGYLIIK